MEQILSETDKETFREVKNALLGSDIGSLANLIGENDEVAKNCIVEYMSLYKIFLERTKAGLETLGIEDGLRTMQYELLAQAISSKKDKAI